MTESKTPKFDALMDEILEALVPHSRTCADCQKEFQIEAGDITFFKMFRVPPPKLCPKCRQRRRLAFANYSNIYKRKCSFPGHAEMMISPCAPVMPWIAYCHETYYSDLWDPFSYSRDADQDRSFFDQFFDLMKVIPMPGVRRDPSSINSDFSFYGRYMKNCYYAFGGRYSEDVMFSSSVYRSKHVADSYSIYDTDTVTNSISVINSFKINFGYFSQNCLESDFIFDCRNCQNCFVCVNLRNKNYCWFNEQLSKEEYLKKRTEVDLGSIKTTKEYKDKFWNFIKENPIRASRIVQSNNCSGEDIRESNNCYQCFQVEKSENIRYAAFAIVKLRDSMDVGHSGGAERHYDSQNCGTLSSNVKFSFAVKESRDCDYLMTCRNCHDCFGCVGLNNASYCILNKKYSPEEYWKTLDEVKSKMLQEGKYGEFFPMSFSVIAYNSSLANIMYPMTETEAKVRGLFWQADADVDKKDFKSVSVNMLPDSIVYANDEISGVAVLSEASGKPFRITRREIDFYKKNHLALPINTPSERMLNRFKTISNFQTSRGKCFSCGKEINSFFKESDGFKVFCEECYKREVL